MNGHEKDERYAHEAYSLRQLIEQAMRECTVHFPVDGDELAKYEWCRLAAILINAIVKRRGAGDPAKILRRAWRETKKLVDWELKQQLKEARRESRTADAP